MNAEIEKKKRKRGDNWTAEDKILLQDLVRERVSILENKNTDTNTNRMKQKAWVDLLDSFNEISATKRNVVQIKTQWSITKMTAKKTKSDERREILKTGGGAQCATEPVSSEDISSWLPNEFIIDFNSYDSDKNQQIEVPAESLPTERDKEECENNQSTKDKEALPEIVAGDKNANGSKPSNRETRKRKHRAPDSDAAKAIMECNLKCTKELHDMKMKTEEMKQKNLAMEYAILQEQMKFYANN